MTSESAGPTWLLLAQGMLTVLGGAGIVLDTVRIAPSLPFATVGFSLVAAGILANAAFNYARDRTAIASVAAGGALALWAATMADAGTGMPVVVLDATVVLAGVLLILAGIWYGTRASSTT